MSVMERQIAEATAALRRSRFTLALTGAGISVESGIPDFRSAGGLWSRFDPAEYATIAAFNRDPAKVWQMLAAMNALLAQARPNPAHLALAELERRGRLHYLITQNVDNLHQAAGSDRVIEYHGNAATLSCPACGADYTAGECADPKLPRCTCGQILKPDLIFFGEEIPAAVLEHSRDLATVAEVLLVVGTSAEVSPANTIPIIAKNRGAVIIEINREPTRLTVSTTDMFLSGKAGEVLSAIIARLDGIEVRLG